MEREQERRTVVEVVCVRVEGDRTQKSTDNYQPRRIKKARRLKYEGETTKKDAYNYNQSGRSEEKEGEEAVKKKKYNMKDEKSRTEDNTYMFPI